MKPGFEDKFMELQAEYVAFCMDLVKDIEGVEKAYIYISNEKDSRMFNAFYKIKNEIGRIGIMPIDSNITLNFLRTGTKNISRIRSLCEEYEADIPTQIKMYYDVASQSFEAKYKYEPVWTGDSDVTAFSEFEDWAEEETAKLAEEQK